MDVDEYPYAGIDFHGDLDMPLQPRAAYGDIGKNTKGVLIYLIFLSL